MFAAGVLVFIFLLYLFILFYYFALQNSRNASSSAKSAATRGKIANEYPVVDHAFDAVVVGAGGAGE